jgi:hypothetical protein
VHVQPRSALNELIAEVTLVWVLSADASRVRFSTLQTDFTPDDHRRVLAVLEYLHAPR